MLLQEQNSELLRNNQNLIGDYSKIMAAGDDETAELQRQIADLDAAQKQATADLAAAQAEIARVTTLNNNTVFMRLTTFFSRYYSPFLKKYCPIFHFSFFTFQFHKEYQG